MDIEITIFIPCLNEEENVVGAIDKVVQSCTSVGRSYEIIVYDDGSRDRTYEVVQTYRASHPELPITVIRREHNVGLAYNFFDGASLGKGMYYRCVAGDDYELPEAHDAILRALGSADIIVPVYVEVENKGPCRMFVSRLFTQLVNLAGGYRLGYYNGFAVFRRRDVLGHVSRTSGFGFQAELMVALLNAKRSYREIKLKTTHKTASNALTMRNFVSVGQTLLRIMHWRIHRAVFRA